MVIGQGNGNARAPDRYLVVGDPVEHSRSPRIHALFAAQTGQAMRYERLRVSAGGLAVAVRAFAAAGGCGLNVTVPLKEEAWALADTRTTRAERAGAVNTLKIEGGALHGDNTDGVGLVRDLVDNLGIALAGRTLLVLGAGGAARGILGPLLACRPVALHVANRTAARAAGLVAAFADLGPVGGGGFASLVGRRYDVVVNATAASLHGVAPALPESLDIAGAAAYDLVYADRPTPFMEWARARGATRVHDGLGMLVEQAAESFALWRGVRPETAPVLAALRAGD